MSVRTDFAQQLRADRDNDLLADVGATWELIRHFPRGDIRDGRDLRAIVVRDHEEGSNEVDGDGPVLDTKRGERERQTWIVELAADVATHHSDTYLIPDVAVFTTATLEHALDLHLWKVKRHTGRDDALQTLRLVRSQGRFSQAGRLRRTRSSGGR